MKETGVRNAAFGADKFGLTNLKAVNWNFGAPQVVLGPRAELVAPELVDLLALDDAGFRAVFSGSPIKRIGRDRMVRNVCIAAGNSGDVSLRPALNRLSSDADEAVAEAARWALEELKG